MYCQSRYVKVQANQDSKILSYIYDDIRFTYDFKSDERIISDSCSSISSPRQNDLTLEIVLRYNLNKNVHAHHMKVELHKDTYHALPIVYFTVNPKFGV